MRYLIAILCLFAAIPAAGAADPAQLEAFVASAIEYTKSQRVVMQKELAQWKSREPYIMSDKIRVAEMRDHLRLITKGRLLVPPATDAVGSIGKTSGVFAVITHQGAATDTAEVAVYRFRKVPFNPPGGRRFDTLVQSSTLTRGDQQPDVDVLVSSSAVLRFPGKGIQAMNEPIDGDGFPDGVTHAIRMPLIVEVIKVDGRAPTYSAVTYEELKPYLKGKKIIGLEPVPVKAKKP